MAYNTSTDYTAQNAVLKKQLEAETDAAKKAALQAQINANQSSKEEKIASDLTAYGKYANDSELNNAAGIMAQNQIGTGYETQKANLNLGYDNAKQNANNDALSRGRRGNVYIHRGSHYSNCKCGRRWVTVNTTYYGLLKKWVERETDETVINATHYGSQLPNDLMQELVTKLASVGIDISKYASLINP